MYSILYYSSHINYSESTTQNTDIIMQLICCIALIVISVVIRFFVIEIRASYKNMFSNVSWLK